MPLYNPAASSSSSPVFTAAAAFMDSSEINPATGGLPTTDSYTILAGDRVVVSGGTAARNGIWVAAAGAWSRATDCTVLADVPAGKIIFINANQSSRGNQHLIVNFTGTPGTVANLFATLPLASGTGGLTAVTGIPLGLNFTAKGQLLTTAGTAIDSALSGLTSRTVKLAVGTDGQVLTADSAQSSGIKWAAPGGYVILAATRPGAGQGNINGTVSYFGYTLANTTVTTADVQRVYVPFPGTVTKAYGTVTCNGASGSTSEAVTVAFRKNNTTDTTITSSLSLAALTATVSTQFNNTGLSIAMAAGDYFEIKVTNPTWVTPPSGNIAYAIWLYIQ